jgi:hypothetical protein
MLELAPVAMYFDIETGMVDISTLIVVAESKGPYVEVLDSTRRVWVAFRGRISGPIKFWGDGSASDPYLFRKPSECDSALSKL